MNAYHGISIRTSLQLIYLWIHINYRPCRNYGLGFTIVQCTLQATYSTADGKTSYWRLSLHLKQIFHMFRQDSWNSPSTCYCALLLTILQLRRQCQACVGRGWSKVSQKEVCQPEKGSLMYPMFITCQFKSGQNDENRGKVEWIVYFGPYRHLHSLWQFGNALSELFIKKRWSIREEVFLVANCFARAVFARADYPEAPYPIALRFFVAIVRQAVIHSGVSCSTVVDELLICRLPCFLRIHFRAIVEFPLRGLRRGWVWFDVFVPPRAVETLWKPFGPFLRGTM